MPSVVTRWQGLGGPEAGLGEVEERRDGLRRLRPVELEGDVTAGRLHRGDERLAGGRGLVRHRGLLLRARSAPAGGAVQPAASFCPRRGRRGGRALVGRACAACRRRCRRGRVGAADEAGHDDHGCEDEDDREDHAEDLLVARRVAHRGLLGLLLLFVAAARTCAFLLFGHDLSSYGPRGLSPGVRSFYGTPRRSAQRDGSRLRDISPVLATENVCHLARLSEPSLGSQTC